MPDLGKYALEVTLAYAGSITLLVLLVAFSVWRARKVKAALEQVENER